MKLERIRESDKEVKWGTMLTFICRIILIILALIGIVLSTYSIHEAERAEKALEDVWNQNIGNGNNQSNYRNNSGDNSRFLG